MTKAERKEYYSDIEDHKKELLKHGIERIIICPKKIYFFLSERVAIAPERYCIADKAINYLLIRDIAFFCKV